MVLHDVAREVVVTGRWYLKYRTRIWSTVFFIVGALGGSVAAIQAWIPTLKTDTTVIEEKLEKIEQTLDKLQKDKYNKEEGV